MANWQPIRKNLHKQATWQSFASYHFAGQDTVANLLLAELASALPYYPIGFVRDDAGGFKLVVIQSLQPGLNLFVNAQGRWRVPYVPAIYRGYPFRILQDESLSSLLCVDTQSELFCAQPVGEAKAAGQALFDEKGELSEPLKRVFGFLEQCELGRGPTELAVSALAGAQLIVPWEIKVQLPQGLERSVEGLFKVDEPRLQALDAEALGELHASSALALAYAQLLSTPRLSGLGALYQMHEEEQKSGSFKEVDLDLLFGDADDSLSF